MNKRDKIILTKKAQGILKAITRIHTEAFSITRGIRAAIIAILPIIISLAINQPVFSLATLGTTFIAYTEAQNSTITRKYLLIACLTQATAFVLGILASATGPILSPILLAIVVTTILVARVNLKWQSIATYSAITFAVGLGITGYSGNMVLATGFMALTALMGGLLGLFGIELQRLFVQKAKNQTTAVLQPQKQLSYLDAVKNAALIGVASAIGYAIGLALGLPRDFWVVITIIAVIKPNLNSAIAITSMRLIGTLAGGLIAVIAVIEPNIPLLQLVLLFFFATLMFATRGVNYAIVQVFLVPYVIILLNFAYPGAWYFVIYRVLDVTLGCVIALSAVFLVSAFSKPKTIKPKIVSQRETRP
jgi:hypothetical protein